MMIQIRRLALCAIFVFALSGAVQAKKPNQDYALTGALHLTGATRWDYLAFDAGTHRLFITRGDSVDVLDTEAQKIIGTIPDTHGAHGVVLAPELGKGFISDGATNMVTVFDLSTLKPLALIPVGIKPDAIVYDAKTGYVFTADGGSNDVTAIDVMTGMPAQTIKLGGKPEFAVTDGQGRLYVNIEDTSQLAVIDSQKLTRVATYDLAPACDGPTGLAIDAAKHRLFAVCGNQKMVVVQAETGKIIASLPIGAHSDAAAFDAGTGLAFSSNGDGTLTVVGLSARHYKVLQTIPTKPTARTMAPDPKTHTLYLAAAEIDGAPVPAAGSVHEHAPMKPDSFMILTVEPQTDAVVAK